MGAITEEMKWRESMIKYARRYGVASAAKKYKVNKQYIYRWKNRYNENVRSLANKSTRPHFHPNQHTKEEIKLIKDMHKRNVDTGLVVFWVKLRQRGYTRSIESLYRQMQKLSIYRERKKKKKKQVKKYVQMTYPGERVQVDIKYVPQECLVENLKLYQYTAIDEYTRLRHIQIYDEASTYTSMQFIKEVIDKFKFEIKEVRTDNGIQFTNRLVSKNNKDTMFEKYLNNVDIKHDLIKPFTPKHNGKVERSHRKDSERFYKERRFHSLEDARKQMKIYLREYNNFPMKPLNWKTPLEILHEYKKEGGANAI